MAETTATTAGRFVDPFPAYNFKVIIGTEEVAHFTECSGITVDVATIEYREGGQSQVVHKIPTVTTYDDVTLRYGMTSTTTMWDWFLTTAQGRPDRRNVTIMLLNSAGSQPVMQWDLNAALPVRWRGAMLRATAREVAVEEVVLAYESLGRTGG